MQSMIRTVIHNHPHKLQKNYTKKTYKYSNVQICIHDDKNINVKNIKEYEISKDRQTDRQAGRQADRDTETDENDKKNYIYITLNCQEYIIVTNSFSLFS